MNRMIALVVQYLLCVLPMVKMWHFSSKFDQHLSLYCDSLKPKFKTGPGYWFLWEACELGFPKFTDSFGTAVPIFNPLNNMEKNGTFSLFELKPVSMEMGRLHALWHFTVPVYWTTCRQGGGGKFQMELLNMSNHLKITLPLWKTCIKGYSTSYPKLVCFVLYLKIINTFLKNNAYYSKLFKVLKNCMKILVGQAISKLWIKTVKTLFGSITREPLGLPKFWCYFWVPWTIYCKMHTLFFSDSDSDFFQKILMILR